MLPENFVFEETVANFILLILFMFYKQIFGKFQKF